MQLRLDKGTTKYLVRFLKQFRLVRGVCHAPWFGGRGLFDVTIQNLCVNPHSDIATTAHGGAISEQADDDEQEGLYNPYK